MNGCERCSVCGALTADVMSIGGSWYCDEHEEVGRVRSPFRWPAKVAAHA